MQTAQELKDYFRTTLVAPRTVAQEFLALDALVDFANQNDNTNIPDWTGSLTFQLDGSDDGAFCTEPDTNGRIRFFKTKVNNNTNNAPPTDPLITENAYWIEVSPGDGSAVKEWAPGVYGEGLIIVYFDTSGTGADPDLYVLAEATRPFHSTNFTTELAAGKWKRMQTVFDVAATGGTDVMNIGTNNADVINIGRVGATVNIYGNTIYSQVTNLEVSDKLIRLNRGGAAASAGGSGFELEENAVITGYIKTSSDRNGYELKAPNQAGVVTLEFNASGDLIIKPAGTTKLTVSSTGASVVGNVSNTGALFFAGAVSPAQITGNQNDYNPTDFHNYANVRLSSDASRDITGFGAPVAGEFKVVHNVGSFDIVFKNSDAGSAAANRFALNADFTLKADQSTIFWYDPTSSRWRAIQAGSGGAAGAWLLASGGVFTGPNTVTGTTTNILKFLFNSLGTTIVDGAGAWFSNSTAAAAGAQQISPSIVFEGQGWKTNATAASQSVKFSIDLIPTQGATNPTGYIRFSSSVNGAAYTSKLTINTSAISSTLESYGFQVGLGVFRTDISSLRLYYANTNLGAVTIGKTTAGTEISTGVLASGWVPTLIVTPGAHTSMTAATEFVSNKFAGATQTWLSGGSWSQQRFNYFQTFTMSASSATTVPDAYTIYVDAPAQAGSLTINNKWAAGFNGNVAIIGDLYLGNDSMSGSTRAIGVKGSAADVALQIATKGLGNLSMYGNSVTLGGASYASGSVGVIRIQGNNSSTANQAGSSIEILSGAGTAGNANSGDIYLDMGAKAGTGKVGNIGLFSTNTDFDGAEKVLRIGSRTTAPSGTIVADHAYLYVEDIAAGNAAVHFMTEAGDIVKMYAISGWGTPTNTLTRTTFDTSTVTLQQLAERVGALISDLKTGHGLLKA